MQREDVEQLATELERQDEYAPLGHMGWEAAAALRALLAERDALQGQLDDLRNGWANSVKAHADALAERAAAFAAGQESMRERAAAKMEEMAGGVANASAHPMVDKSRAASLEAVLQGMAETLRALPIKDKPDE